MEGSVIVERQDANAQAYRSDVSAKMLLSGSVPPPDWVQPFIRTLESLTGLPGNRRWVNEQNARSDAEYIFGGVESPRNENGPPTRPGMGSRKSSLTSYFDFSEDPNQASPPITGRNRSATLPSTREREQEPESTTNFFATKFDSDFNPNDAPRKGSRSSATGSPFGDRDEYPFKSAGSTLPTHKRSVSAYTPSSSLRFGKTQTNPFREDSLYRSPVSLDAPNDLDEDYDVFGAPTSNATKFQPSGPPPKLTPKAELNRPLQPHEGVARAIALFDFKAVQVCTVPYLASRIIADRRLCSPETCLLRRVK